MLRERAEAAWAVAAPLPAVGSAVGLTVVAAVGSAVGLTVVATEAMETVAAAKH